MTDREFALQQQTMRRNLAKTFLRGAKRIRNDKVCARVFTIALVLIACIVAALCLRPQDGIIDLRNVTIPFYCALGVAAIMAVVYGLGIIPHAREMHNNLERAGLINHVREAPTVIDYKRLEDGGIQLTFQVTGLRAAEWIGMQGKVESALNLIVFSIEDGANMYEVILQGKPPLRALARKSLWNRCSNNTDKYTLILGETQAGLASMNLLKTPHWLIGATTGAGKTQLLLLVIEQCLQKGIEVFIADWKNGIDFSTRIQSECTFASDYANLIGALRALEKVINTRVQLYDLAKRGADKNIACNNTEVYLRLTGVELKHYVLIVDEVSMVLDNTGRSKEDKAVIAEAIDRINKISRIGRAYGIHLIVATQRPDVNSVPGSVKANLDGRIAGRTADDTSSMVILDNGNAAKLPAIPGRFIIRDGTGTEQTFQAYLLS